jgi:hypothetical protein
MMVMIKSIFIMIIIMTSILGGGGGGDNDNNVGGVNDDAGGEDDDYVADIVDDDPVSVMMRIMNTIDHSLFITITNEHNEYIKIWRHKQVFPTCHITQELLQRIPGKSGPDHDDVYINRITTNGI